MTYYKKDNKDKNKQRCKRYKKKVKTHMKEMPSLTTKAARAHEIKKTNDKTFYYKNK
jgi:hypothetical protein